MFFNEPELIFCLREINDFRASLYLGKHEKKKTRTRKGKINNELSSVNISFQYFIAYHSRWILTIFWFRDSNIQIQRYWNVNAGIYLTNKYHFRVSTSDISSSLKSIITFPISDWCFGKMTFLSMTETSKQLVSRIDLETFLKLKLSEVKTGLFVSLMIAVFLMLS